MGSSRRSLQIKNDFHLHTSPSTKSNHLLSWFLQLCSNSLVRERSLTKQYPPDFPMVKTWLLVFMVVVEIFFVVALFFSSGMALHMFSNLCTNIASAIAIPLTLEAESLLPLPLGYIYVISCCLTYFGTIAILFSAWGLNLSPFWRHFLILAACVTCLFCSGLAGCASYTVFHEETLKNIQSSSSIHSLSVIGMTILLLCGAFWLERPWLCSSALE